MTGTVPISKIAGVQLSPPSGGIARVSVTDRGAVNQLSWDRYVRLKQAAAYVESRRRAQNRLLDVGGFDGALALFLADVEVDLLDPDTTGGSALAIQADDWSYDFVTAIDVLEHVEPSQRSRALRECARVSGSHIVLNYPCVASASAQSLMLKLTGNMLIKQHVDWPLPDSDLIMSELSQLGFKCQLKPHSSVAVWVGQYLSQNLLAEEAKDLNRYLIDQHAEENFTVPLYHLVTAQRV